MSQINICFQISLANLQCDDHGVDPEKDYKKFFQYELSIHLKQNKALKKL